MVNHGGGGVLSRKKYFFLTAIRIQIHIPGLKVSDIHLIGRQSPLRQTECIAHYSDLTFIFLIRNDNSLNHLLTSKFLTGNYF